MFTPLDPSLGPDRIKNLSRTCEHARALEELALAWVVEGRKLVISRSQELGGTSLAISFLEHDRAVALAILPLTQVWPAGRTFDPLNENVLFFNDQAGYRPDDLWFDTRNSRLGIELDDSVDENVAPASAFGELVLSYAFSTGGMAEVTEHSDRHLLLTLVYLGPAPEEEDRGWFERVLIEKGDVSKRLTNHTWS